MIEVRGERTGTGAAGDSDNGGLGFIRVLVWLGAFDRGFRGLSSPYLHQKHR
jgi:hypothetical protein